MGDWKSRATFVDEPSPDKAAAAGGSDWKSRAAFEDEPEHANPLQAGAVHALDSASIVGAPSVLALLDAVSKRPKVLAAYGASGDMPFTERFRKAKDFYEAGEQKVHDENPISSTIGTLAPALIPGGGGGAGRTALKEFAKRGAVYGGAAGLLRGPSKTLDGDILGTVRDTAVGTGLGGLAGIAGGVVGRGMSKAGDWAKEAEEKLIANLPWIGGKAAEHIAEKEAPAVAEAVAAKAASPVAEVAATKEIPGLADKTANMRVKPGTARTESMRAPPEPVTVAAPIQGLPRRGAPPYARGEPTYVGDRTVRMSHAPEHIDDTVVRGSPFTKFPKRATPPEPAGRSSETFNLREPRAPTPVVVPRAAPAAPAAAEAAPKLGGRQMSREEFQQLANSALKRSLGAGAMGVAGYHAGKKLGLPPEMLAVMGGIGGAKAGKNVMEALAKNPAFLARMAKVLGSGEAVGKFLSRLGLMTGVAGNDQLPRLRQNLEQRDAAGVGDSAPY